MPSKKKNSKGKARKAAGKGVTKHGEEANEQKDGALDSQMQRLKIASKQQADDDEDALLEEAIKLAVAEKKDIEEKERANCKHGYNPSSPSQDRSCEAYVQIFTTSYDAAMRSCGGDILGSIKSASDEISKQYLGEKDVDAACIKSWCLSKGTKFILDGNFLYAHITAMLAKFFEGIIVTLDNAKIGRFMLPIPIERVVDHSKMMELLLADEHTLVQFFRKQIPCSCLDEKYEEVKSIPKRGICSRRGCPLPNNVAVRKKMVYCAECRVVNYCSRECQVADWPQHKGDCGKSGKKFQKFVKGTMKLKEHIES